MHINVKRFWKKSIENRVVCEQAIKDGHINVAASRYYYALRLAFRAFFIKKSVIGIMKSDAVTGIRSEVWRHEYLINKAELHFEQYKADIKNILLDAKDQREIGDYDGMPVDPKRLKFIQSHADEVFEVIYEKINTY